MNKCIVVLALCGFLMGSVHAWGIEVKNKAECEYCHGEVFYNSVETRTLLGFEGRRQISKIISNGRQFVKLDLDGIVKNGDEKSDDGPYEIRLAYFPSVLSIKSLVDGSYLLIHLDEGRLNNAANLESWFPELYWGASKQDEISLKDNVEVAWQKMRKSHIYEWFFEGRQYKTPPLDFKVRLQQVLAIMATP